MKNFLFIYLMSFICVAFGANEFQVADAHRMKLEKQGDANALCEIVKNSKDKKLRDGAIYSLGKLRDRSAYSLIRELAFAEKDACPAAILALAEYSSKSANTDLQKLAQEGCKTANIALLMSKSSISTQSFDKDVYQKKSQKERITILRCAPQSLALKNFLLSFEPQSEKEAVAMAFALARYDFSKGENAQRIVDLYNKYPREKELFSRALAQTPNSDDTIKKLISQHSPLGLRAVAIRRQSEAEDELLKVYSETSRHTKRDAFRALLNIASEKSLPVFIERLKTAKEGELPELVRLISVALKSSNESVAKASRSEISKLASSCEGKRKVAVLKLLEEK